jgi:hypothetical protein
MLHEFLTGVLDGGDWKASAVIFFSYLDGLGSVTCTHSELIMKLCLIEVDTTPWTVDQP